MFYIKKIIVFSKFSNDDNVGWNVHLVLSEHPSALIVEVTNLAFMFIVQIESGPQMDVKHDRLPFKHDLKGFLLFEITDQSHANIHEILPFDGQLINLHAVEKETI